MTTPDENMVMLLATLIGGEVSSRGMEDTVSGKVITAQVPLSEMFGYATDLRSATQGRATYSNGVFAVCRGSSVGGIRNGN